ncbi:galactose-binding domain-containing protein [Glycomyces arizonensis]|uniref:galactose-binding domain-containing protein n=1 Tax=Glycomyces arizonensis TaxID=256035 RepID=UPI001B7F811F|nr:discoidin domain-containing protein [Glycomyces arizonensis]
MWNPDTGQVQLTGGRGQVLFNQAIAGLSAPQDVELTGRVVDVFAKAGANLEHDAENLALGAAVSASHAASGTSAAAAVNGTTVNAPIWSSAGSGNTSDWYEVEFDGTELVDEVRLYFYRDRTANGLSAPASYRIEYHDGADWVNAPGQDKSPAAPRANYNKVKFNEVGTERIRVVMDHQAGHATGLKEIQAYYTAEGGSSGPENVALAAAASASYTSPWETITAVNDGIDPPRSNDTANSRWGAWPEEGEQWVQLEWTSPVTVTSSDMYFFDDNGGVRVPASWHIEYLSNGTWQPVNANGSYGTAPDQYNSVDFDAVTTTGLRAVLQSGAASVGVLEWKVFT